MAYYRLLDLNSEPFSNSPEPDFFYQVPQHVQCLQKLEISIRLRRGLSVVVGEVGTGKTTLSRMLIRNFRGEENVEMYLLLDPDFSTSLEFLITTAKMFGVLQPGEVPSEWRLKEDIKEYLFQQTVHKGRTIVLIIDEGQKIPGYGIELLREFLNYETNQFKLLQIVLFAQQEFQRTLDEHASFADRINFFFRLRPLNFRQTKAMIRYRVDKASEAGESPVAFTTAALWAIYRATGGYPRKIMTLGHQILLKMIVLERRKADWPLVRACIRAETPRKPARQGWRLAVVPAGALAVVLAMTLALEGPPEGVSLKAVEPQAMERADAMPTPGSVAAVPAPLSPQGPAAQAMVPAALVGQEDASAQKPADAPAAPPPDPSRPQEQSRYRGIVLKETPRGGTEGSARLSFEAHPLAPPPAPSVGAASDTALPKSLGQLTVRRSGTVKLLMDQFYGKPEGKGAEIVARANPKIPDLRRVKPGSVVSFPALPALSKPYQYGVYWIQLFETETLADACAFVDGYPGKPSSLRILPYWNSREGLRFAVLHGEGFNHEKSARKAMKSLPRQALTNAKVISEWDEGTIFFADLG